MKKYILLAGLLSFNTIYSMCERENNCTLSNFEQIPLELKVHIFKCLVNEVTCILDVVKSLKHVASSSTDMYSNLVCKKEIIETIIQALAEKYNFSMVTAAIYLKTKSAQQWLMQAVKHNPKYAKEAQKRFVKSGCNKSYLKDIKWLLGTGVSINTPD